MIELNIYLIAYLFVYLVGFGLYTFVERINVHHLKKYGRKVPVAFEGVIDEKELEKIVQYSSDNVGFKLVKNSVKKILFLCIILSGILPWFAENLTKTNYLAAGLTFFAVLALAEMLTDLPFDYYHSFVIEDRYGFNTKTIKIWLSDLIKSLLVMIILGILLLSAILLMMEYTGQRWWIWTWGVFLVFQLLMTILYPTVIAPLFNTFTPLEDSQLKNAIRKLAEEENLNVEGIYQMDASRRTRHTNAYFSGLGSAKRIVLFDSLLQLHGQDEIIAILAHEIGHLKKKHIIKQLVMTSLFFLLFFFLSSKLISWPVIYESFGFSSTPYYVGLFLVGVLWGPVNIFLSPFGMAISRRFEREADYYSKMAKENLSNLRPHPLYVYLNYSHPPLLERIDYLEVRKTFGHS
jgi:STE24 endopeptidase